MSNERRQYVRMDDNVYFDFCILKADDCCSDLSIRNSLLGDGGQKYLETLQYFQTIDYELFRLNKTITEPSIVRFLNLVNAKIDYLARQLMIPPTIKRQTVNLSLGGVAFKTSIPLEESAFVKIILYTKPKMIPIFIDGTVVYSRYQTENNYRTAVSFNELTPEQEHLLSQHILLAQVKCSME